MYYITLLLAASKSSFFYGFFVFFAIMIVSAITEKRSYKYLTWGARCLIWIFGCLWLTNHLGMPYLIAIIIVGCLFMLPSLFLINKYSVEK
jgi:hypothetical protein